jgi:hypothetical protein
MRGDSNRRGIVELKNGQKAGSAAANEQAESHASDGRVFLERRDVMRATFFDRLSQLLAFAGAAAAAFCAASVREPLQISCKPAKIAMVAITIFNFRAGTFLEKRHPTKTPGTPPISNWLSTGPLIEPNFH